MPIFYEYLDEHLMSGMYKYQYEQLDEFKARLEKVCSKKQKYCSYRINIHYCDEPNINPTNKEYVVYYSDLKIDFTNRDETVIKLNGEPCSFSKILISITYNPLNQKYKVFINDDFDDLWINVKECITKLNAAKKTIEIKE